MQELHVIVETDEEKTLVESAFKLNNAKLMIHKAANHLDLPKGIEDVVVMGCKLAAVITGKPLKLSEFYGTVIPFAAGDQMYNIHITYGIKEAFTNPAITEYIAHSFDYALHRKQREREAPELLIEEIEDATDAELLALQIQTPCALDIETNSMLSPFRWNSRITSIAVTDASEVVYVVPEPLIKGFIVNLFERIIENEEDEDFMFIGHNIKFDVMWMMHQAQISPDLVSYFTMFDTLVLTSLIDENNPDNGLKGSAFRYCNMPRWDVHIRRSKMKSVPAEEMRHYNAMDALASYKLYEVLHNNYIIKESRFTDLFWYLMDVERSLIKMELAGIKVDTNKIKLLQTRSRNLSVGLEHLMEYISGVKNLNVQSPKQLMKVLNVSSTDEATLKDLLNNSENPVALDRKKFVCALLAHRTLSKQNNTFLSPILTYADSNSRIHTMYNIGKSNFGGTVTGRLSSSNPNLQNIPKGNKIRNIFIAEKGYKLIEADYSQLELRIGAWLAQEPALLEAFHSGLDPHTAMLARMYGAPYDDLMAKVKTDPEWEKKRKLIKILQFGIFYGMGRDKVQATAAKLGIHVTAEEAAKIIEEWSDRVPKLIKWIDRTKGEIIDNQETTNEFGLTRRLLGANNKTLRGFRMLRQGVNFRVQSVAALLCEFALVSVDNMINERGFDASLLHQVHDSHLVEVNENQVEDFVPRFKEAMETTVVNEIFDYFNVKLDVPFKVDIKVMDMWR